ncbi:MAG: hypothetical protein JNK56_25415 [Myxococcales bacterium]|nr:hypothetical protein [Myxococcales bacterium]
MPSVDRQASDLLRAMNHVGGFPLSLVCTEAGLLVACAGELRRSELAAVVASLFSDIAARAAADLELPHIDELTLSDPARGRLVVRPLDLRGRPRLFLVAQVPRGRSWRRSTTLTARRLDAVLRPLLAPEEPAP